jgi:hypothetical protein
MTTKGVRYELLPTLLALGRLDEARALIKRYKNDCKWTVVFAWGRVLERLLSGAEASAATALAGARAQNPHMEAYLKGRRKLPRNLPGSYSPGNREEALCYAEVLVTAWKAHPKARAWLLEQSTRSMKSRAGMGAVDSVDAEGKH